MGSAFTKDILKSSGVNFVKTDNEMDEHELACLCYKPESLENLLKYSKFSKRELKVMYRSYKQACPNGYVSLNEFKNVFAELFPNGDSAPYATFVFKCVIGDIEGRMSFAEVVQVLSTVSRGTVSDKLEWAFRLYDLDQDGQISYSEIRRIVASIFSLMNGRQQNFNDPFVVNERSKDLFQKLDLNKDGVITRDEFFDACQQNYQMCESLQVFDTIF